MKNRDLDLNDSIKYPEGSVMSKVIDKNLAGDVTLFCMAAGSEMSEHTSAKEGFVYVVEGKGMFNLEGEDIVMKPGVMIFMEKDAKHSLKADENTSFILNLRKPEA